MDNVDINDLIYESDYYVPEKNGLVCQYCTKTFKNKIILKMHIRDVHPHRVELKKNTDEEAKKIVLYNLSSKRPYPCNRCDFTVADSNELGEHLKTIHQNKMFDK